MSDFLEIHERSALPFAIVGGQKVLLCSFCCKGQRDVRILVAGVSACICDECVRLSGEIVAEFEVGAVAKEATEPKVEPR